MFEGYDAYVASQARREFSMGSRVHIAQKMYGVVAGHSEEGVLVTPLDEAVFPLRTSNERPYLFRPSFDTGDLTLHWVGPEELDRAILKRVSPPNGD